MKQDEDEAQRSNTIIWNATYSNPNLAVSQKNYDKQSFKVYGSELYEAIEALRMDPSRGLNGFLRRSSWKSLEKWAKAEFRKTRVPVLPSQVIEKASTRAGIQCLLMLFPIMVLSLIIGHQNTLAGALVFILGSGWLFSNARSAMLSASYMSLLLYSLGSKPGNSSTFSYSKSLPMYEIELLERMAKNLTQPKREFTLRRFNPYEHWESVFQAEFMQVLNEKNASVRDLRDIRSREWAQLWKQASESAKRNANFVEDEMFKTDMTEGIYDPTSPYWGLFHYGDD